VCPHRSRQGPVGDGGLRMNRCAFPPEAATRLATRLATIKR
jgi:hypothetical protein